MERRVSILVLVYAFLVVLSIISLYGLSEKRVDVYVSLNILTYYVSYAIVRPTYTSRYVKALNILLFIVFAIIVSYRVYEVLST
ncbi:MAG: hypothetical protein LM557_04095 [Desulfurococcaceae archaeon]|nr:hypothetical protein [Desulfurococcaceae archaeon]